ncbi:MAG TPA: M15 family metallopeptidase [Woeseiaceae bacterium]|nr:M15 family metallopeptidase [Woeseiaceae bacterium]
MLLETYQTLHRELGIPPDYAAGRGLPYFPEARRLVDAGPNLVGRMQRLAPEAAVKWRQMVASAEGDGIRLLLVSGFRSFDYQGELIRKKLVQGQAIAEILRVNAAPGFSQHHTGLAVDVATPGSRPLTEEFEHSDAFRWLGGNAANFGFSMTYPKDNPWGFIYEPWHWSL